MNSGYPDLAAPEISKVASVPVATPKSTATPAEQRENSHKHFRKPLQKATSKSAAAEEAICKYNTKLEAAIEKLEGTSIQNDRVGGKKEAYAELTRAQNGVVATILAMPTARGVDLDETDAQVRLARATEESAAKRRTNTNECDASARAQAELDKAIDDASRAVLGGKPAVGGSPAQPVQQE